jgi:apolipoprotein N-acyltransferase
VLFASNNGRTVFLGADGQPQSERLELFMPGVLVHQLVLESRSSFSRDFPEALAGVWGIGLLLAFWSLRSGSKRSARRSR